MSDYDEKLEEKLQALERGVPLDRLVESEETNSSETGSLIRIAAAIKDLPHPERYPQEVQAEKRKIVSTAREKHASKVQPKGSKPSGLSSRWMFLPIFGGLALILMVVCILAAGAGIYFSGPRGAQAAILTNATGVLEISDTGVSGDWRVLSSGEKVYSGQRLRTGDESWVTLEFFDGTHTTLAPNTDLMLNKIDGNWGNELQVELIQNEGETNHHVVPLQGDQSIYQVVTPSGEARVRGTSFKVMVEEGGVSLFTVETGEVLVSNDGTETYLAAGQGVITEIGEPLAAPKYLFELQGNLITINGRIWDVEDVPITVKGGTKITGDPQEGKQVLVKGRITKKNEWIADRILAIESEEGAGGTFTGVVTSAGEDGLAINGYPFTVDESQPDVAVGDLVRVTFMITEDGWMVLSLVSLDGGDNDIVTDIKLNFDRDEEEVTACELDPEIPPELFSTSLNYKNDDVDAAPLMVYLSLEIMKGKDEGLVTDVLLYLDPDGDPLNLAEPILVPWDAPVEIFAHIVLADGVERLDPGDVVEIQILAEGELDGEDLSDKFNYKWDCEDDDDDTDDDLGKEGHYCTTSDEHPHAATLAKEYKDIPDVTYENIMIWFCDDNLGFGEIELGFKIYRQYKLILGEDLTIHIILDKRIDEGLGWGQIKHYFADLAKETRTDDEPDAKKEPPGKQKSEDAKNKEKPSKKKKDDE